MKHLTHWRLNRKQTGINSIEFCSYKGGIIIAGICILFSDTIKYLIMRYNFWNK